MPTTRTTPAPHRGLLAGLIALVVFASAAVSMTAQTATGSTATTTAAPVAAQFDPGAFDGRGDGRDGGRVR